MGFNPKTEMVELISDDLRVPSQSIGVIGQTPARQMRLYWLLLLACTLVFSTSEARCSTRGVDSFKEGERLVESQKFHFFEATGNTTTPNLSHDGPWLHTWIPARPILLIQKDWFLGRKKGPQKSFWFIEFTFCWLDMLKGTIQISHSCHYIPVNPIGSHSIPLNPDPSI